MVKVEMLLANPSALSALCQMSSACMEFLLPCVRGCTALECCDWNIWSSGLTSFKLVKFNYFLKSSYSNFSCLQGCGAVAITCLVKLAF